MVKVEIRGLEVVKRHLSSLANPNKSLDNAIKQTAIISLGELQRETTSKRPSSVSFKYGGKTVIMQNLNTGTTARGWTSPLKVPSGYSLQNSIKSGKYLIADIIDSGHKRILPKKKVLYMPLNRKGYDKKPGATTNGLILGKDFIFVKKIKATKGTGYLKRVAAQSSRYFTRQVLAEIKGVLYK